VASAQKRIEELTRRMLRKKLYVVLSKGVAAPEQIAKHLPAHLEFMIGLEKKGIVFASGPLSDPDGQQRGNGLTILRAAGVAAARRIAASDPFVTGGLRTFEVREWTVMEGSLGIRVNFSDQSLDVA
jgi:uncharacterized protein YciI